MDHPLLTELLAERQGVAICWLGNLSWLIASRGRLIAFDLDLDQENWGAPARLHPLALSTSDLAPHLDTLFISHGHGDHFNKVTCGLLSRQSTCRFVLPANCVETARRVSGIDEPRIVVARPRQPFDLPRIKVEPFRALHGDRHLAVHIGANLDDCGYLLTIDGLRIFQPGDSVLLQDHLALRDIDVLFVSPTIHNMHIQPATTLIATVRPRHVFPQHFDTYAQSEENSFWTHGYPDELRRSLDDEMQARFHKLVQGQVFVVAEPAAGAVQAEPGRPTKASG